MKNELTIAVPSERLTAEEHAQARALRTEATLWQLLLSAKQHAHPATWGSFGLHELESFLEALASGGKHPLLDVHAKRASKTTGRPSALGAEQQARRMCVLAAIALQRVGVGKEQARRWVVQELERACPFITVPSRTAIERWGQRMPTLTPVDEILLARAIAHHGASDLTGLVKYFISLAHSAFNPVATLVRE